MEINIILHLRIGFLGASDSKECRRPQVQSLSWEDPLKKDVATHSSILAWEIPWTEEPGGLPSMGSERVQHDIATETTTTKNRVAES